MGLAIKIGVADSIAVAVVAVSFGLAHEEGSANGSTQCVVGPAGGAAFGIGLGELIARFIVGVALYSWYWINPQTETSFLRGSDRQHLASHQSSLWGFSLSHKDLSYLLLALLLEIQSKKYPY